MTVISRMIVNETERTLVERAREVEKLSALKVKLEGEVADVKAKLAAAQRALVEAASKDVAGKLEGVDLTQYADGLAGASK